MNNVVSCAQTKQGIKNIYAYSSVRLPGNIPVEGDGTPTHTGPDTLNIIYIETGAEEIQWNYAWKNGKGYHIITNPVTQTPVDAGIEKGNDKKIILTPAKGNKLWHLELVPDEKMKAAPKNIKRNVIQLQGKLGKQMIVQNIEAQTELVLLPSY
jgi:hypothetical protein